MITQDQVKDLFHYNTETGVLTNRKSRGSKCKVGAAAGYARADGYMQTRINYKKYLNHRLIFLMFHGYLPDFIDHIDNDSSNNRIKNLRECTISENVRNSKTRSDNTSGIKGVSWHKPAKKWRAYINHNSEHIYLGLFKDIRRAKLEVEKARINIHEGFCNHG